MPPKITKEISSHLIKYVKTIDIHFNPFDRRTRSARELMRQVLADRYKKANTKLKINTDIHGKVDPPLVAFKFADDSELKFDSQEFVATEMLGEVFQHANNMDIDYEMNGKSIED